MAETRTDTSPDLRARFEHYTESADGAIGFKRGVATITKVTAAAMTLALPTAGADDGKELIIIDGSGASHTVTTPANGINGNHHILTFDGTIGAVCLLVAYNGAWYGGRVTGVTIS